MAKMRYSSYWTYSLLLAVTVGNMEAQEPSSARVVVVADREATRFFQPQPMAIKRMVTTGMQRLTGEANVDRSWRKLFAPKDVVGIKVVSAPGPIAGTRPAVVMAVVAALRQAGMPGNNIIIWDGHRSDLRRGGYLDLAAKLGVRALGAREAGLDPHIFFESSLPGNLFPGDLEYDENQRKAGFKSHVTRLLTERVTKLISIAPLLTNDRAGVHGHLMGMALSAGDNTLRFQKRRFRVSRNFTEEAVSALCRIADRTRVVGGSGYTERLKQAEQRNDTSGRGLLPFPAAPDLFYFYTGDDALPLLKALRLAHDEAISEAKRKDVIIFNQKAGKSWKQTFLPDGRAIYQDGPRRMCLHITDALLCQFQGTDDLQLHYTRVLNELWFSRDPVALDVKAVKEIDLARKAARMKPRALNMDMYHLATSRDLGESDPTRVKVERINLSAAARNRE